MRSREKDAWRLEPEGETEVPETVVADEVEGTCVDSDGEGTMDEGKSKTTEAKVACKERKVKKFRAAKKSQLLAVGVGGDTGNVSLRAGGEKPLTYWQWREFAEQKAHRGRLSPRKR